MRFGIPTVRRNPLSLISMAITTVMAMLFIVRAPLDAFGRFHKPYFGFLLFVAVPAAILFGHHVGPHASIRFFDCHVGPTRRQTAA